MNRREILKYTALTTGAALSAPLISIILSGCKSEPVGEKFQLKFFNENNFQMVKDLVDVILPKTDSPSASEVGVHKMMDHMAGVVYTKEHQEGWKNSFGKLASYLGKSLNGKNLGDLEATNAIQLLKGLEQSDDKELVETKKALTDFKQQAIAYYLSTEEIGTKFLNYLPVPGEYQPCIKLEEVGGKKWAL